MIRPILFALTLFTLPTLLHAEVVNVPIDANRSASLDIEDGWELTVQPAPPTMTAATVRIVGSGSLILITLIGPPDGTAVEKDQTELRKLVEMSSTQYITGSVEQRVNFTEVKAENINGGYAVFTDKRWANKTPTAGQYKYVTNGMFVAGGIMAAVTYLSNETGTDEYNAGLDIVLSVKGMIQAPGE